MKPYIEFNGEKIHLPQEVDPHKYEVCSRNFEGKNYFILCRKVSKRYRQATGVVLEHNGKEMIFHLSGNSYVQHTFPLEQMQIHKINIDWNVGATSIVHEQ